MGTNDLGDLEVTVEQEIATVLHGKPHVLLLGAGASKAALPGGDKHGRAVLLLRDVAESLSLIDIFPELDFGHLEEESGRVKLKPLRGKRWSDASPP